MKPIIYTLADVKKAAEQKLFTVISTFAGGGGSSTGYRLAGADILAINEFIPDAQKAYETNYPETLILRDDIRKITPELIFEKTGIGVGELDILDGSPPCASFSMSGDREKGWGKTKKYSDTEQRTDDLFFEFARILKGLQPKGFIAENVKGLTVGVASDLLGSGQRDFFGNNPDTIYDTLIACGYKVDYRVLNSKHYGVPQARERVIFIGVRNDIDKEITWPKISKDYVKVGDAFKGIDNSDQEIRERSGETNRLLKLTKAGESFDKYHPKGNFFNFVRCHPDQVAPTLTASPALFHHTEHRLLTIKECIRVQSFPDDYYLGDKFNKQWERLGRSVPPLMMKAVAEHVYNTILK